MRIAKISRRRFLERGALAAGAALAAPYVRSAHAAGELNLAIWDHWVPDVNQVFQKVASDWGAKNHVEVNIDFITSQGDKDILTASGEAQARTGHDIMSHRSWQIAIHRDRLEPVDEVVAALQSKGGALNPVTDYLAKFDGHWHAVPTTYGSQVKPCCSRLDLYAQHAGLDLRRIFPANDERDPALIASWNWDTYLASAEALFKAGLPVGLPMGQTSDAVDWVGALFRSFGAVMIDEKDNIKVESEETRAALDYVAKLMKFNPPQVYAWDDAGNNRWLISGKGSGIMNPPSAWAVAKRDAPAIAAQCWTHDMPRGPKGRFVGYLPFFYGLWNFARNKSAAKDFLVFISEKEQARRFVEASSGYDLPPFKSYYDFDTWQKVEPPPGTVYNYPLRGDEEASIAGFPARPDVAASIYNLALQPVMIAKLTQGGESVDEVIRWAAGELQSYLRG
ncbi:MAG TPA: extracellular solute-binding protein [Stellaceae bacterium]|nr:extracellular solute-binding protein [Stellaceae bacterium]